MRPAALDAHKTKSMWWILHFGGGETFNLSCNAQFDDNASDIKASVFKSGHQKCSGVPVRLRNRDRCVRYTGVYGVRALSCDQDDQVQEI